MMRSYDVIVHFTGDLELTVEANSAEEAERLARMEFSVVDIDDADVSFVTVIDDEDEEENQ